MQAHRLDPRVDASLLIGFHIQLCTGEILTLLLLLPLHISGDGQVTGDAESSTLTTRSTAMRNLTPRSGHLYLTEEVSNAKTRIKKDRPLSE